MQPTKKYKRYSFILTHFRRQINYLNSELASTDVPCNVCFYLIEKDTRYWYPADKSSEDKPNYICYRCKHMFELNAIPNKPYWLTKPTIGATNDIRTNDDRGIREYLDGTYEEWNEIWDHDRSGTRFP